MSGKEVSLTVDDDELREEEAFLRWILLLRFLVLVTLVLVLLLVVLLLLAAECRRRTMRGDAPEARRNRGDGDDDMCGLSPFGRAG